MVDEVKTDEEDWKSEDDEELEVSFVEVVEDIEAKPEEKEEEDSGVGGGVQKRIDELTRQRHDADRRAADIEAKYYAGAEEVTKLRQQVEALESGVTQKNSTDLKSQYAEAQRKLEAAIEAGDSAGQIEYTTELTDIRTTVRLDDMAEKAAKAAKSVQAQAPQQQQQQIPQAAKDWVSQNTWFNDPTHKASAAAARQMDNDMKLEGLDGGSPLYYAELDRRLQEIGLVVYNRSDAGAKPKSKAPIAPARGSGGSAKDGRPRITREEKMIGDEMGFQTKEEWLAYAKEIELGRANQ